MTKGKVVLAYSGGLDTSIILKWLIDKGYDVVCFVADLGQKEDFAAAKEKALKLGASKVYVEDLKEEFVKEFIFPAIKGNAIYEGKYLLGTSLARPLIARKQIEIAKKEKINAVAHGATGKGNDQVRFEMAYLTLMPEVEIISPWKNKEFLAQFQGREAMIDYAKEKGIPIPVTKKAPYSSDANIMHISYEAGVLEDPMYTLPEEAFQLTVSPKKAPDKETLVEIEFVSGIPVKVTSEGKSVSGALKLFIFLNEVAGKNGVGRIDMVEDRFVGMKSRGVYETPAGTVLRIAHLDLEGMTLDREVMAIRDSLVPKFSSLIYNGFWFAPEMELLMAMNDYAQKNVTGVVKLSLYKGNCMVVGRSSQKSLYNAKVASMDIHGGYDQTDAIGFIKLNALRLREWAKKQKS